MSGVLTDKQEKFVQGLIAGKSQRQAYKAAYNCKRMKDTTIDVRACELFASSNVKVRYDELHDRLIKEAEDECIVTAKEVLKELVKIGFSDIKDYLAYRTVEHIVDYDEDTGVPITANVQMIDLVDSDKVDGTVIQEVSINARGNFTFKLYDKMSALDKLGKHLGLFTDKVEVSGKINNPFEGLTTEQLIQLVGDSDDDY